MIARTRSAEGTCARPHVATAPRHLRMPISSEPRAGCSYPHPKSSHPESYPYQGLAFSESSWTSVEESSSKQRAKSSVLPQDMHVIY
jgi:hypothetical protein